MALENMAMSLNTLYLSCVNWDKTLLSWFSSRYGAEESAFDCENGVEEPIWIGVDCSVRLILSADT